MGCDLMLVVMFVVYFVAFGLAFAAEQTRSTAKVMVDSNKDYSFYIYDSIVATYLGICAFVLFLVSQILMVHTSRSSTKSPVFGARSTRSVFLSVIAWTTFFIGEACLLVGTVKNAQHTKYRTLDGFDNPPDCRTFSEGVFEVGAVSILVKSMVSRMNYICSLMSEHGSFDLDRNSGSELGSYTSLP